MYKFLSFFIDKVYAFDTSDYPQITYNFGGVSERTNISLKMTSIFGDWYTILKYAWFLMLMFSLITFLVSIMRLAFHSEDHPFRKEGIKHDFIMSLILFAILGGTPLFFSFIIGLLNG